MVLGVHPPLGTHWALAQVSLPRWALGVAMLLGIWMSPRLTPRGPVWDLL